MIVLVTTRAHRYTHYKVAAGLPGFRLIPYPVLAARRSLPRAAYIFSDFDRLSFWQLELAAHLYRQLRDAGCPVLNDPARALQRVALLRRLHACGINSFAVWPATEWRAVDHFPVFLRTAAAHRGNLTDLIEGPDDLDRAIEDLVAAGQPLADLMIAEYRAEPLDGGVYRKLSVYRVGDRYVATPSVHERHWTVKYGEQGVAGEEAYARDLETVRANPHGAVIARAFEEAGIDYGRADFGIADGRPEIYEINTNPMIAPSTRHPFPDRLEAFRLSHEAFLAAIAALDPGVGGRVRVERPAWLAGQRRLARLLPGYLWTP
ncbi:MAG: hypothetical protein RID91_13580 [Azospirillaceae bacterium]